ncbi:MAG TPA: hypothetical protein VK129_08005, partial [Terriglobales bacterium]|nr:hypothetical protein [Terriglobales bacterium]
AACKFHQRGTSAFQGNRIDHRATLVTDDISQITAFLHDEAAIAIRSGGDFVGDDHVAAFIFGHSKHAPPDHLRIAFSISRCASGVTLKRFEA